MNNLLGYHQALSVTISRSSTWSTVLIDDVEVVSVDLHTREEHGSRSWNRGVNLFHRKVGQAGDKVEGVEDLELVSSVDKRVIGLRTAEALRNLKQGLKWKIGKFAKQQFLTNLFSSITNWSKPWEITQRNCRGDTFFQTSPKVYHYFLKCQFWEVLNPSTIWSWRRWHIRQYFLHCCQNFMHHSLIALQLHVSFVGYMYLIM